MGKAGGSRDWVKKGKEDDACFHRSTGKNQLEPKRTRCDSKSTTPRRTGHSKAWWRNMQGGGREVWLENDSRGGLGRKGIYQNHHAQKKKVNWGDHWTQRKGAHGLLAKKKKSRKKRGKLEKKKRCGWRKTWCCGKNRKRKKRSVQA